MISNAGVTSGGVPVISVSCPFSASLPPELVRWRPSRCQGGGRGRQRPQHIRPLISIQPSHYTPAQDLGTSMDLGYQLDKGDWSDISLSKSSCGSLVSRFTVHKLLVWSTFWRGQNYSMGCPHCVFSPDNLLAAFSGIWLKKQNMLFVIATSTLI